MTGIVKIAERSAPATVEDGDLEARFAELQSRLASTPTLEQIALEGSAATLVSVCSIDLGEEFLAASDLASLETRWLYHVLLALRPGVRVAMVTSDRVPAWQLDYWRALGGDADAPTERLAMIALDDLGQQPLAAKLLAHRAALARIRSFAAGESPAFIASFSVGQGERDLALALDIPVQGIDHRFAAHATKTGSRELFAREGLPHPRGRGGLRTVAELVDAILELRGAPRPPRRVVVKLDRGTTGLSNRIIDIADGDRHDRRGIERTLAGLPEHMRSGLAGGAVVEELLEGAEVRSPSAQVRIGGDGQVTVLATHDQLLAGPHAQSYVGCRFPAEGDYAASLATLAERIGRRLAADGAVGRFAVDFVVTRERGRDWQAAAIEINLREGGTTHPHGALQLLTGGEYDPDTGLFTTARGNVRFLRATDALRDPANRAVMPRDLIAATARGAVAWDRVRESGVVFTMLRSLATEGRIGFFAVGRSPSHCDELVVTVEQILERLAREAHGHLTAPQGT